MNIVLIGFMASGKTTIGKALALKMNMDFVDADELIEKQQNISIEDMFSLYGEAYFREIENRTIKQLLGTDGFIIAVGGGAVMYYDNLDILKKIGVTVFLDAPIQKILMNLSGKFRPLVGNTIDEANIRELLEHRYPTYKRADIVIKTDNLSIQQTVDEIVKELGLQL
jgi:shikimate kinase